MADSVIANAPLETLLRRYYEHDEIRARMAEFLGGTFLNEATAVYISGFNCAPGMYASPRSPSELPMFLEKGWDIERSLWDHRLLLVDLDLEYVNFDFPGEPYLDPFRVFELQRPVVRSLQEILVRHGISPLHMLSGRGHHFLWSIRRDSPAFEKLVELGHVPETLAALYNQPHPPEGRPLPLRLARAFAGLGLVMEYLSHRVLTACAPHSSIPVQLTEVEVGRGDRGRETVSIDVSEYADPLHTRRIRIPYSVYFKPQRKQDGIGSHVVRKMPALFQVPLFEMDELQAISVMRGPEQMIDLARRAVVRIPDQSEYMDSLIDEYRASSLASFHNWFYEEEQNAPCLWPETYDQTPLEVFPPCVQTILQNPNELLLKPAGLQHVVRVLLALDWHPRHIAGLICSKYERDFGWGERWKIYDPANRADFYTRIFSGLIATGVDQLCDFNNVSNREKGYCFQAECGYDLRTYRDSLLAKKPGSGRFAKPESKQPVDDAKVCVENKI